MSEGLDPTTYLYPDDEDYQDFLLSLGDAVDPDDDPEEDFDDFDDDDDWDEDEDVEDELEDEFYDEEYEDDEEVEPVLGETLAPASFLGILGPAPEDLLDEVFGD